MIANKCETGHKKVVKDKYHQIITGKKQVPSGCTPGESGLKQRVGRGGGKPVGSCSQIGIFPQIAEMLIHCRPQLLSLKALKLHRR
jgi:hypothetical protein